MNHPQLFWRAKLPPVEALQVPIEDENDPSPFLIAHGRLAGWLMRREADFTVTDTHGIMVNHDGVEITAEPGQWLVYIYGVWFVFDDEEFLAHFHPA